MHLEVHTAPAEGTLPAEVHAVEDQGSCKIVTFSLAGHTVRARLPEERPAPQEKAWLGFPPQWTRLFVDGRLIG
jgi:glycerol transport system ATP-binding protein